MHPVTVRVKDKKALKNKVEDLKDEGWIVESQSDEVAVLKRPGGIGRKRWHFLILVFTVWWAWVIPNVVYALYSYFINVKRTIVKLE